MRCYLVQVPAVKDDKQPKRYAGTQADARKVREELAAEYDVKKSSITIEEAEVPTSKGELLEFINKLCKEIGVEQCPF